MKKVFISATSVDLATYVERVEQFLRKAGFEPKSMVDFGAQPEDATTVSLAEIDGSDLFVGIYGRRYGYIPAGMEHSITEQEYHHARAGRIPTFAFLVDPRNSALTPGAGEDDDSDAALSRQQKLARFLANLETTVVRERFATKDDLVAAVLSSLDRYKNRPKILQPPVNTLRLKIQQEKARLFHNDQELGEVSIALDTTIGGPYAEYQEAKKRSCHDLPMKNIGLPPSVAMEKAVEHLGDSLGQVLLAEPIIKEAVPCLEQARALGQKLQCTLESADGRWSALPLETLKVPGLTRPLTLKPHVDLVRLTGEHPIMEPPDIDGPLKLLMAVAAPWQEVEQPLLDYERELGNIMNIVESLPDRESPSYKPIVHILEQATLEEICRGFELNRYHVLHISCHGGLGKLFLENEDGAVEEVTAEDVINIFPVDRKPLFTMLSACHTGIIAEENLKSFAEQLVHDGFPYVVAMQGVVSDHYATEFCTELYRQFAYGERVIERAFSRTLTVLEAQRKKANRNRSPEVQRPPEWMIPALYKTSIHQFAIYEDRPERFSRVMEIPVSRFQAAISYRRLGEFVGRRQDLIRLKREVLSRPHGGAALVTGMGGVGKSTLVARAMADYLDARQEKPELVTHIGHLSLVDFLQQQDCRGEEIGHLVGDFFQRVLPAKGERTIYLFDNFEDNLEPGAKPESLHMIQEEMTASFFAMLLMSKQTRVLVTSRYPFALPENRHYRFTHTELGALSPAETRKLISRLRGIEALQPEEKGRIVRELGGHPRILEYLDAILLQGEATYRDVSERFREHLSAEDRQLLKQEGELPQRIQAAITLAARDCLLDELLGLLTEQQRQLLYCLSVFRTPWPTATCDWLIKKNDWPLATPACLARLERLSLVFGMGDSFFVHRWTAEYLREKMGGEQWCQANILAAELYCEPEKISIDDGLAAMHHYLAGGDFAQADNVARPLEDKLDTWGYWDLRRQVIGTMIKIWVQEEDKQKLAPWLYLLGILHQQTGDYQKARKLYEKSLEINKKFDDLGGMARSYHQLGMLHQLTGEYQEARTLYEKSLEINEKLDDLWGMARSYHQLGMLHQLTGEYQEARTLYEKSLEIKEKLVDLAGMSKTYHQLGRIHQDTGDDREARTLYQRSLKIEKKLGDLGGMAGSYHQLGVLCQRAGDYRKAQKFYEKSLEIEKKLGNPAGMATSYGQLGLLMDAQGDYREGLVSLLTAFFLFHRLGSPSAHQALGELCRIAQKCETEWQSWLQETVEDAATCSQLIEFITSGITRLADAENEETDK